MSGKTPTKPPTAKPFLGDDDLLSELDAWDQTFDALHETGGAGAAADAPPATAPMAWPEAQQPPAAVKMPITASAAPSPAATEVPSELPTDLPLSKKWLRANPGDTIDDEAPPDDPAETDFSEVGVRGGPAALGELLGRPSTAPPSLEAGDATRIVRMPGLGETITDIDPDDIDEPGGEPGAEPETEDEDEVFTSASRPLPKAVVVAPPPVASPAPAIRRPAIIRRTASTPTVQPPPGTPMPQAPDDGPPPESTRVVNVSELEGARTESRSKTSTIQPPIPQEDDYADIEMVADDAKQGVPIAPASSVASVPPVRRTAHVLRRNEHATRPPPSAPATRPSQTRPAVEVDADEPARATNEPARATGEPARATGEADFSDVAKAVGTADELAPAAGEIDLPARQAAVTVPPQFSEAARPPRTVPTRQPFTVPGVTARPAQPTRPPATPTPSHAPSVDNVLADLDDASSDNLAPTMIEMPPESGRPPALVDLYPRVKTPTSVPPLGMTLSTAAAMAAASPAAQPSANRTLLGVPLIKPKRATTGIPEYIAEDVADIEPTLELDRLVLPEQVEPLSPTALDEDSATSLAIYERELATVDESLTTAALRMEAGRLAERLGEIERARTHYDAALLADPRATTAMRGLRRIARSTGDLTEATRQLDTELAIAGALERRPLAHYRVDLLMASGEQDLARVAVGEILDGTPSDVRALLAQLELAFLDGRADEFGTALEQLADAVVDQELRAAVQSARAALAAHHNDGGAAATWFAAAAESDPAAIGARLGAIRNAAAQADGEAAGRALVDLARSLEASDPTSAAALAVRAQQWSPSASPTAGAAVAIATATAPGDPVVARLAAEHAVAMNDPATAGAAFALWATCSGAAAERGYAAARAAELIPVRGAELWSLALELTIDSGGGDDYAAAQLRTSYVALVTDEAPQSVKDEAMRKAIDVDLAICNADIERDRARLRAAFSLIGENQLDAAIDLLANGRASRPGSLAIAEALGEALANAQRWTDRAQLFAELADDPGDQLDAEVAQLRSAIAWEEAVGAAAAAAAAEGRTEHSVQKATANALSAWNRVLEQAGASPAAHASAIVLASRLGDRDVLAEVLARAQSADRSPWAVASLGLRRARLFAGDDPQRSDAILRELADPSASPITAELDDPRRTALLVIAAARRREPLDAAHALADRAARLASSETGPEAAALRLRAAQLALDAGDAGTATALLGMVERALPSLNVVPDLLAAARRRAGDRTVIPSNPAGPAAAPTGGDAYARLLRDADLAASQDDGAAALALYQRALELRPDDPLAVVPLVRVATQLREPAPLTQLALARLRTAEAGNDNAAKAEAYELLARIDADLRDDAASAQIALESASQADPSRIDLVHRLERHYAATDRLGELIRLRRSAVANLPETVARDRAALLVDLAGLASRDQRGDAELGELYRGALASEPHHRLALFHLEALVRRQGASLELAELEDRIASYFAAPTTTGAATTAAEPADPRSVAAFYTRAGETLAEIGRIPDAVARFAKAVAALPGHVFALEGWRAAALKGQLWSDVADAATRQAAVTADATARGALHHLAGVALMDKALDGAHAMASLRRALEANPHHGDAFLRLRILLEEDGNHDDLATLLALRLEVEPDARGKIELHRALAELHRNFLSDREAAKRHYRAILAADPNDLRAHAAVADIAWEQGNWEEAADALVSRARLEREPDVLKTLCYRLGLIYADRLVNVAMAIKAFQRALTYAPDDENTLVRLADLATSAGEWKLALGACERLVKAEQDPERRAAHLQRVAKIFKDGFNDAKRAERALNLALDSAPTSDDALTALVEFYQDAGDMVSVRVHLNRVAGAMRARFEKDASPAGRDGVACRVISRAMTARDHAGVAGSLAVAHAAAELADLLGAGGEPERELLARTTRPEPARLLKPETDEVLFPRGVPTELRQIFQLLGDRVAKHVGVDLRPYGATRGDRLRARDNPVAATAQDVATQLGFGEIDVYVSTRQPFAMVAEPTSPVSLIVGQQVATAGTAAVRFAAGAALKLAQASLAIPARMAASDAGVEDLGVLVVALLRLFQPEFPALAVDLDAVTAQMQKLKRLIPTGLSNELRPFALAIDAQRFGYRELARDIRVAGLRAGLVASGSLVAGLAILAAQGGVGELAQVLSDPAAIGLVAFALGEDHATVAR